MPKRSGNGVAVPKKRKNPAAVALGRKGGKVGGKARMEALTPDERTKLARKAARKRWGHEDEKTPEEQR
jgi:hypothetical protein